MKPDYAVRRGDRNLYMYLADEELGLMAEIAEGLSGINPYQAFLDQIGEEDLPLAGDYHVICYEDGTSIVPHQEFLRVVTEGGGNWQQPVHAGPEADAYQEAHGGEMSVFAYPIAQAKMCEACPMPGYTCMRRTRPFSQVSLDAIEADPPEGFMEGMLDGLAAQLASIFGGTDLSDRLN